MIRPSISFWLVRALNCLQNSIMLICACPSAGPTGGAGVALPASICSFTLPVTFFAIAVNLPYCLRHSGSRIFGPAYFVAHAENISLAQYLFHLAEFQLYRS